MIGIFTKKGWAHPKIQLEAPHISNKLYTTETKVQDDLFHLGFKITQEKQVT
jgi:hypothetical protein